MVEPVLHQGRCGPLEWAACSTAYPGQRRSGDAFLVSATETGARVTVVDALGHGDEAADVAELAVASLRRTAGQPPVTALNACHRALQGSRGAAVTLVEVDSDHRRLVWAAVGNVDAAVLTRGRRRESLTRWSVPLRGGIVGHRLPALRDSTLALPPGGVLVAATDGMAGPCLDAADPSLPVNLSARRLHHGYARSDDDALVLVACYG
ncbi:MAG: serine/threonine-protein phosphatase [Actinobacteria bacterium]|nr:serine/threonine-protein phosphatase [Actinomycetota bacterium]MBW3648978.1 serine/threonine-protein phosphatase [Actinomycetota bacterium]